MQDYIVLSNENTAPFVSRNSLNSTEFVKTAPSGMAGPNVGTSLERDTAMLQETTTIINYSVINYSVINYSAA